MSDRPNLQSDGKKKIMQQKVASKFGKNTTAAKENSNRPARGGI
jgi:hypothetical protein